VVWAVSASECALRIGARLWAGSAYNDFGLFFAIGLGN